MMSKLSFDEKRIAATEWALSQVEIRLEIMPEFPCCQCVPGAGKRSATY
jgi:hypothetical protein